MSIIKKIKNKVTFNLIKDSKDFRDWKYKSLFKYDIPERIDLRDKCSPVENQLKMGSCGPNAMVGILEYNDLVSLSEYKDLSRLFIYYNTRKLMRTINEDSGVSLRALIKATVKYGTCEERMWKYSKNNLYETPPLNCYVDAKKRKIVSYYRITSIFYDKIQTDIKKCLYEKRPVLFGLILKENFFSKETEKTGQVTIPTKSSPTVGGHALLIVGYDNTVNKFIVRNSWGNKWGDKGYCYIPYEYVINEGSDFWIVTK